MRRESLYGALRNRRGAEWTPDRFRRWAGKIGPSTEGLITAVLASRPHPEQGLRTCLGILKLYRGADADRVEAVSARAVEIGGLTCKSVASLLAQKHDKSATKDSGQATLFDHANLRTWALAYDVLLAPHHCSWHSLSWDSWSDYGEDAEVSSDARNALGQAPAVLFPERPARHPNQLRRVLSRWSKGRSLTNITLGSPDGDRPICAIPSRASARARTLLKRTEDRFSVKPEYLTADSAYGSAENLAWLVKHKKITPHIPVFDKSTRTDGTFSRAEFAFDPEGDRYTCPAGKKLIQFRRTYATPRTGITAEGTRLYRASKKDCDACELKARCCPNAVARKIPRDLQEGARDVARALAVTPEYEAACRRRKKVDIDQA
jgi:hypothetical protein